MYFALWRMYFHPSIFCYFTDESCKVSMNFRERRMGIRKRKQRKEWEKLRHPCTTCAKAGSGLLMPHLPVTAQYPAHSWLPVCHNATTNHNHWRASLGQRKPCPLHPNTAATFVLHAWLPALSTLKFRSPAVTWPFRAFFLCSMSISVSETELEGYPV